jgi:DNA-binding response OmpR family regulator
VGKHMKRTVLLVDDDDSVLETISPMLTDAGYDVLGVAKARIGFDEFQSRPVDLIITDILMPEMEGIEFILKLRKESPSVPIIAISGSGRSSTIDYLAMARRLGATAVLEKPFGREELLGVVAKVLAS